MKRNQASHITVGDKVIYKGETYQVAAKYHGPRNANGHQKRYWPRFDLKNTGFGSNLNGISYMFLDSEKSHKKKYTQHLPGGVTTTSGVTTVTTCGAGSAGHSGGTISANGVLFDVKSIHPRIDGIAKEYVISQLDKAILELQELRDKYR